MKNADIEYFGSHLALMTELTGMAESELIKTRRYPTSYYRAMLAHTMRNRGLSLAEIGTLLNRDHSTILHMLKKLDDALACRGYGEVKRVWQDYRDAVAQMDGDTQRTPSIVDEARDFVGLHCNRRCRFCRIKRSECRYLQDERLFLAGAKAQRRLLKAAIGRIETLTASCSMICGKEGLQEAFAGLEDALADAELNYEDNVQGI